MNATELKQRFRQFSVRIVRLVDKLPNTTSGKAIGNQIVRSGTSPGANYRAACRAKSDKDFINKLKIVEEELDETDYWIELISDVEMIRPDLLVDIRNETKELLAIITQSIITKRKNINDDTIERDSSES